MDDALKARRGRVMDAYRAEQKQRWAAEEAARQSRAARDLQGLQDPSRIAKFMAIWVAGSIVAQLVAGPVTTALKIVPLPIVFGALLALVEMSRAFVRDHRSLRERLAHRVVPALIIFVIGAGITVLAGDAILLPR